MLLLLLLLISERIRLRETLRLLVGLLLVRLLLNLTTLLLW